MVEIGISILDNLIKLFNFMEKHDEKYFNSFIEPMYADAERIMYNYSGMFHELIKRLESDEDIDKITIWILEKRVEFKPLRMKVRALLDQKSFKIELADKFQKGIWFLLKGGISFSKNGHADMNEYGMGDHTVLDLIKVLTSGDLHPEKNEDGSLYGKERYILNAKRQLNCIELAWQDIVDGYAILKQNKML